MKGYKYVYVLQSLSDPARHYTGMTDDLKDRLRRHNAGECTHTANHRPWQLRTATTFSDHSRASAFEAYLKTHSDRVFASHHF